MFGSYQPFNNPTFLPHNSMNSGVMVSNRRLQNINCIVEAERGVGGLYLGDIICTLKQDIIKNNQIGAVLTCMVEHHPVNVKVPCRKILPIQDTLEYPIIQHFDDAAEWIQSKRNEGYNVLVHCHAGVSRSATIVIAYLLRSRGWTALQALEFVRSRRQRAKPNVNFWGQLNQYQNRLVIQNQKIIEKSRKSENLAQTRESKQNIDQLPRASEPISFREKEVKNENNVKRQGQLKLLQNKQSLKNDPPPRYQRKKIFEKIHSPEVHYKRPQTVSRDHLAPPHSPHPETRRCTQSIIFPSHQDQIYTSRHEEEVFTQNRSAIEYRVVGHPPPSHYTQRIYTPQPIVYYSPMQVFQQQQPQELYPNITPFDYRYIKSP